MKMGKWEKSVIWAATIATMTTATYAQDRSPPNCPPGYQCILTDPNAAAKAAPDAATKSGQEYEQPEQPGQPMKWPDPTIKVPGAEPNDVSVEVSGDHPDPCWSLRLQYMHTPSSDSWWAFQNCLMSPR